jgi:hypothetical protein
LLSAVAFKAPTPSDAAGAFVSQRFPEPVHVRQVTGRSNVENRFEARQSSAISPLYGREEELELLLRRWEQVRHGESRIVLITGEGGIGKSRLVRALQLALASKLHTTLNYHGSPHHRDSALWPVISQLRRAAGIEGEERAQEKLDKLDGLLSRCRKGSAANLPVFAALLSIPAHDRYALPGLSPQRVKERILRALLELWGELAADKPALIVFEDVHWLDPTSLELLCRAIDPAFCQRVLLLATARPECSPPWPNHRHVSSISLRRLGQNEGKALAQAIAGKTLPNPVAQQHMGLARQHSANLGRGHTLLGQYYFAIGAFLEASRQFRQALAIFAETPEDLSTLGAFGSQRVVCLSLLAGVHFALDEIALARPSHPNAGWSGCRPEQSRSRRRFLQSTRAEEFRGVGELCQGSYSRTTRRSGQRHRHYANGHG